MFAMIRIGVGLCCLTVLIGCGEDGPPKGTVSGIVTIGGEPPKEDLRIHFFNSTLGSGSQAKISEEGFYELTSPILVGEYRVYLSKWLDPAKMKGAVSTAEETPTSIPPEYRSEMNSPLTKAVTEGGNSIDIKIPKT